MICNRDSSLGHAGVETFVTWVRPRAQSNSGASLYVGPDIGAKEVLLPAREGSRLLQVHYRRLFPFTVRSHISGNGEY